MTDFAPEGYRPSGADPLKETPATDEETKLSIELATNDLIRLGNYAVQLIPYNEFSKSFVDALIGMTDIDPAKRLKLKDIIESDAFFHFLV